MLVCALQNGKTAKAPCTSRSALFERAMMPIPQMGWFIAENGGRSRPRREPSVLKPKPIWSPIFSGMVVGKRGVKLDIHCGLAAIRNSSQVCGRCVRIPCINLQDHPFPARNCPQSLRSFTPKKKPKKEVDYFWKHQTSNSRLRHSI